jgi:tetratricopeptide (TPR) repeat protein
MICASDRRRSAPTLGSSRHLCLSSRRWANPWRSPGWTLFVRTSHGWPAWVWLAVMSVWMIDPVMLPRMVMAADQAEATQEEAADKAAGEPAAGSEPKSEGESKADEPEASDKAASEPARPSFRLQESDDDVEPLKAKTGRTSAVQNRLQALSWFGTGRLHESRGELAEALKAYRKAIDLDSQSIEIYRALIPLAMRLEQADDAFRWSLKAVELDPEDYELLSRIGVQLARQGDLEKGLEYLTKALKSPRLSATSPTAVMLQVEVGSLQLALKQLEAAAESYSVVFDALRFPEKYGLDFRARTALLADPRTSYERLGTVLMEGRRFEQAELAFELAAKSGRVAAGNLSYNKARLLLLSDKPEAALTEIQTYFDQQRQSKGRDAYLLLKEILTKLNRADEVVARIESLAEQDPRNNALQYFLADQFVDAGDLDRAKAIYETVLSGGGDPEGFAGLASVLRRMKRADELLDVLGRALEKSGPDAIEGLEVEVKAIAADTELVNGLVAAANRQGMADPVGLTFAESYLLAKVLSDLERVDEATQFYRKAGELDKDRRPLAMKDLGDMLMDHEKYADAAAAYNDGLQGAVPDELRARFYLGLTQSHELAGQTKEALSAAQDAKRFFPQLPIFEFQEAWIYYHSRQWDEAISRFEAIMANYPEVKDLVRRSQYSLSNIYVLKGELRKGEEILEQVLEQDPEDPAVNNDLGYLYADQGKFLEKAEVMIRKAVAAEPENAAYLDSLGWVLFKLGKVEEAVAPLEKATQLRQGGDATIWDHLGDVYHRLERRDAAIDAWTKAFEKAQAEQHPDLQLIERIRTKLGEKAIDKPGDPSKPPAEQPTKSEPSEKPEPAEKPAKP